MTATVAVTRAATLFGTARRDLLIGTALGERFEAGAGDDDIFARGGDDFIASNDGADLIDGGDGVDTVSFATSSIGVRADVQSRVGQGGYAQGDVYRNVEALEGSSYADQLYGDMSDNRRGRRRRRTSWWAAPAPTHCSAATTHDTLIGGAGADSSRWRRRQ